MSVEDLTTWTLLNPESVLSVTSSTATATGLNATSGTPDEVYLNKGAGFYPGDFTFRIGPVNISAASSNNSRIVVLGAGIDIIDDFSIAAGSIDVCWVNTTTNPTLSLAQFISSNSGGMPDSADKIASYQNAAVGIGTSFWLELARTGSAASCKVYSDAFSTLLTTLSIATLASVDSFQYVYTAAKCMFGSGATVSGTMANVDLSPGGGGSATITPTAGADAIGGNAPGVQPRSNAIIAPITARRRIIRPTRRAA